ncbi:hypothetical protein PRIPAC_81874 [Pristionchus pacificus]|uniref:Uncharacterized protein n=1 Tax=Pristionchus pacificus TaxID=54126 RepID=A0A2A6CBI9_PRIPA|nr:hypothetical protein PRIPAC_81874 [Pristionchus pacificus]|eukprot:PDM75413.1 hypothetical protein PRIPAC_42590 [Pristionchus pacificus]
MSAAVVLQRDDGDVQVWLSKEKKIEVLDSSDCPNNAVEGTPIKLKMDSRHRVEECTVIDRPLKMSKVGQTMFLDIFYFPEPGMAFSLYFGAIPIDPEFTSLELDRSYLLYVTWDKRRCEMIILKQSPPRIIFHSNSEETNQLRREYDVYQSTLVDGMPGVRNEEQPRKEKITAEIHPMERRDESKRDEDERSMSDRMSSISLRMDSVSLRGMKMDDGRSSVRSSSDVRTEQPSMTYSSSFNDRNDSRMSISGYSREGSAIHSSSSHCGRTVENDSNWLGGIVMGEHQANPQDQKKFFVWTKKGKGTVYPQVYEKLRSPLKLGDYVKVELRSRDGSDTYEVEHLEILNDKPSGINILIQDGNLTMTCDVKFTHRLADNYISWWAGENWLLGPIGVEVVRGDANMVKRTERMTVKPLVPGFSLALEKLGVGWVTLKDKREPFLDGFQDLKKEEMIPIEKKEVPEVKKEIRVEKKREEWKRQEPIDGWYTGIVTAVTDESVFVASPQLNEDAVLYQRHSEDVMGLWIKFHCLQLPGDPSDRYRIDPKTFSKIEPIYETRIKRGVPEIRLSLSYGGDEDDGRPMLNSTMGRTDRDVFGRFLVANHNSRWRFSRVDPQVEKDTNREMPRSRSPSPTTLKHRAIDEDRMRQERLNRMEKKENEVQYEEGELELREIMKRVILENEEIRSALKEADTKAYNEMFEILMED